MYTIPIIINKGNLAMNKDQHLEQQEEVYEAEKEELIKTWISNGANHTDAAQLFEDMVNDPFHSDPDMVLHFDPTIDDRLQLYSSREKQA